MPLIRSHHERLDGKGYPDGLHADQIPLLVRILSICDVYDSLSSDRPYRASIAHSVCLEMLRENAFGGGLDPELVAVFSDVMSSPWPEPVTASEASIRPTRSSQGSRRVVMPQGGG